MKIPSLVALAVAAAVAVGIPAGLGGCQPVEETAAASQSQGEENTGPETALEEIYQSVEIRGIQEGTDELLEEKFQIDPSLYTENHSRVADGSYGVEAGHEPVVAAIEPGETRYKVDGVWTSVIVTHGFAEIMSDYAVLLVSTAERPEEIDEARAQRAKSRAEERLRQHGSQREYYRSKAALARATARLSAVRRHRGAR